MGITERIPRVFGGPRFPYCLAIIFHVGAYTHRGLGLAAYVLFRSVTICLQSHELMAPINI